MNLSAVHRCIKSAMLTIIVPGIGVAETNFFSLLTTCTMNGKKWLINIYKLISLNDKEMENTVGLCFLKNNISPFSPSLFYQQITHLSPTWFCKIFKIERSLKLNKEPPPLRVGAQAPVFRKVDGAIHWINHYPLDSAIGFPNTYLMDSDLSNG